MIIYHNALSCKHSDPIWTTLIFFWKKKSLKKNTENSISEIIDFKTFESIPLEPIATLTADLKPNLWQTPVGNFRINGLGLTQTKRKNIYIGNVSLTRQSAAAYLCYHMHCPNIIWWKKSKWITAFFRELSERKVTFALSNCFLKTFFFWSLKKMNTLDNAKLKRCRVEPR